MRLTGGAKMSKLPTIPDIIPTILNLTTFYLYGIGRSDSKSPAHLIITYPLTRVDRHSFDKNFLKSIYRKNANNRTICYVVGVAASGMIRFGVFLFFHGTCLIYPFMS